jgi:2-methylaconitate cis-trans-isomerase PrpF
MIIFEIYILFRKLTLKLTLILGKTKEDPGHGKRHKANNIDLITVCLSQSVCHSLSVCLSVCPSTSAVIKPAGYYFLNDSMPEPVWFSIIQ